MVVAHSTLTGTNLHEPKGVATAAANTVYVANGLGSGTWTNISSVQNPFANARMHLLQNLNTVGNTLLANTWNNRAYNTVRENSITGSVTSTPFITLPAGDYWADIDCQWGLTSPTIAQSFGSEIRLHDVTNDSTLLPGGTLNFLNAASALETNNVFSGYMPMKGVFTVVAPINVVVQQFSSNVNSLEGFAGVQMNIVLWKVR